MEKWENPEVISENQLNAHATLRYRETLDLNGPWKFQYVSQVDKADPDFYRTEKDVSSWDDIPVPSCWHTKGYGKPYYFGAGLPPALSQKKGKIPTVDHSKTGCGCYRRTFVLDRIDPKKQYVLRFDSVRSAFSCYFNDSYVGLGKGSMLPCEFDVTPYVKEGTNTLGAMVREFSDATYLEDQDMWFLAGIYRDVTLYCRDRKHIEDIYLHNTLSEDYRDALLIAEVEATGEDLTVEVSVAGKTETVCIEGGKAKIEIPVTDVCLWSAETPSLYPVKVSLKEGEEVLEEQELRYGFRETVVDHEKGLFLHNGKPIKLRGVNYHAFTPRDGYTVPEEVYRKDLALMKQANFNAIRTSHYPQADLFYDLADEYGFYVMDECNVETHAVRSKNVPGDDPKWTGHVTDRMRRMVLRDRNHPCVTIYSLGNESDVGENHFRMKEEALRLDPTRPIHYEGGKNLELSDFLCDGYSSTEREQLFAEGADVPNQRTILQRLVPFLMSTTSVKFEEYRHHPVVLTEYNYCMGNAGSDVGQHVEIMDKAPRFAGGFVWDFKDKSLLQGERLTYGGDWGVKDQQGCVCCDGVMDPFSKPHSVYEEIRHGFQPFVFTMEEGRLSVYNRNFFLSSSRWDFDWELTKDGKPVAKGTFEPGCGPRETAQCDLEVPVADDPNSAYYLNVFCRYRQKSGYAEEGDVCSYQQFALQVPERKVQREHAPIEETANCYLLKGKENTYEVDRKTGDVVSLKASGKELLKTPLRLELYRPYTDGDVGFFGMAMKSYAKLDDFGKFSVKDSPKAEVSKVGDKVQVRQTVAGTEIVRKYGIAEGKLLVEVFARTGQKKVPNRIGMSLGAGPSFGEMIYFGKGPTDHYPGKDESGLVGIYSQDVTEQDEYVRPQEHGNRSQVHWAALNSEKEMIRVERASELLNASVWPYTLKDLHSSQHIDELPDHEVTTLNIDCIQNGLSDCFVPCKDEYKIQPETAYTYSFLLSGEAKDKGEMI
ncbi:MAG: DUF4981 domain-containing protein [Oscillospiraceae bacterium]|nr:DUF4981 domain-containing protein [Oscillospiraceae bacterium]